MATECDIEECSRKAYQTYEDMEDGTWIDLCRLHARKFLKIGAVR